MALTSAQNLCLLALLSLGRDGGDIASKDIADWLGISRPSVHKRLESLQQEGMIVKNPYSKIRLSEKGMRSAKHLEERSKNVLRLFSEEIGLDAVESAAAVTLLMGGLSPASFQKMEESLAEKNRNNAEPG